MTGRFPTYKLSSVRQSQRLVLISGKLGFHVTFDLSVPCKIQESSRPMGFPIIKEKENMSITIIIRFQKNNTHSDRFVSLFYLIIFAMKDINMHCADKQLKIF